MCGICGYYNERSPRLLAEMCDLLAHRGPDDRGSFVGAQVGLGMTRLAIIDPATGHQPIVNEDGRVVVVFNGEIYNFRALRDALLKKGHKFRTGTDTEVIVHLYEDLGPACVDELRGIFALAVWDGGKLFLARDRLGVKPLYYTDVGDRFYFASEIKALLAVPGVHRDVDLEALDDYMTFQYVAAPKSIFRGVNKLPAGYALTVGEGGRRVFKYWDLPAAPRPRRPFDGGVKEMTAALVADAVHSRMVADVPLGALLSGGLDSSLVVGLLSRFRAEPVTTFHIRFAGEEGEEDYARLVADRFACDHHELTVGPEALDDLPRVLWHLDEPLADAAAWATYHICRYAKQYVTVLLTGEGGDEVFAGYPRYLLSKAADYYHLSPAWLKSAARRVLTDGNGRTWRRYAAKVADSAADAAARNVNWLRVLAAADRERLYAGDFAAAVDGGRAVSVFENHFRAAGGSNLRRLTATDVKTWLAEDVLMKVDKTSMASGVEARVPLLDHQLVEYIFGLSDGERFGLARPKRLLKAVARGLLPAAVVKRPKRPFAVPLARWLREQRRDWVCDVLLTPRALSRGYFQRRVVEDVVGAYLKTGVHGSLVWTLFVLELWHHIFIDGPAAAAPRPGAEELCVTLS